MPMQPSSLSLLIAGRKWQSGKRDSDGSVPRLLLYPPKAVIFHFSPKVSNVPQPDQGVRSKTSATQRSSGASVDLGRPDTSAAAQNAGDAGRSRFAVARDVRTDHPGVATARRVRSELGRCLIWMAQKNRSLRCRLPNSIPEIRILPEGAADDTAFLIIACSPEVRIGEGA